MDPSSMDFRDIQYNNVFTQILSPIDKELSSQPFLPEELILQILLRLPVRSLLQFRCVCKSWKTLISDPQFAKSHLQCSTEESIMTHQRLVSFVETKPYKILSYSVKTLFENPSTPIEPDSFSMRHEYRIIDSCNGLLCLYDESQRCVRLCNPSTRLKSIRSPTVVEPEPHGIITNYGFGYDQVNDKYKFLVAILNINGVKIYTFGEDSWTTIQNFPCSPRRLLGKFVSGTLNWLADKGGVTSNKQCVILSFNLEKETYGELMLPQNNADCKYIPILYVLNNCLCVFFLTSETRWVMYSMREYGVVESWTKLVTISPEKYIPFRLNYLVEPLFISENDVVLLIDKGCDKIGLYNFSSGGSSYDFPLVTTKPGLDRCIYRESLVSPRR